MTAAGIFLAAALLAVLTYLHLLQQRDTDRHEQQLARLAAHIGLPLGPRHATEIPAAGLRLRRTGRRVLAGVSRCAQRARGYVTRRKAEA